MVGLAVPASVVGVLEGRVAVLVEGADSLDPVGVDGPWMKGRDKVPFAELIEQLQATLGEREKVIAAAKSGIPGPYMFERSVWERVDLLKGGA